MTQVIPVLADVRELESHDVVCGHARERDVFLEGRERSMVESEFGTDVIVDSDGFAYTLCGSETVILP